MNYQRIYDSIIANAKALDRSKHTGYYELHHIVPRCLNGSDDSDNLVLLTPREHFICHYLLWKITPIRKLRDAILLFKGKDSMYYNSRLYEKARIFHIEEMRNNNPSLYLSDEAKASKSAKLKSYIKTEEHRKNISKSKKGSQPRLGATLEEKSKNKISQSLKSYFENNSVSEETREKLRIANTGRKLSDDVKAELSKKAKNRKKFKCEHCGREYDAGNLKQHHRRIGLI